MKNKTLTFLLCSCVMLAPAAGSGVSWAAGTSNTAKEASQQAKSADSQIKSGLEDVSDKLRDADAVKGRTIAPLTRPDGTVISGQGATVSPEGIITYTDGTIVYPDGTVKYFDSAVMEVPASGAAPVDGKQAAGEYLDDAGITAKVKEKFMTQKGLDSLDLHVETMGGVVTLTGAVDNASQVGLAENVVHEVEGVKSVDNKLTVKSDGGQSFGEYIDDASITASVKAKFLVQEGLDSLDISVETLDGTVTLTGAVDNDAQIGLAENVAHEVSGVKSVVNKLSVKQ